MPGTLKPDEIGYVNCAKCEVQLTGERSTILVRKHLDEWPGDLPPPVHIRINGRPYCENCGRIPPWKKDQTGGK